MSYISRIGRSFGPGGLLTALFIAATLLSVSIAQAAPRYWDCWGTGSFNWSDATGNWAQTGASITSYPTIGGTGVICIDHGATVAVDISDSYQALTVGGYSTYSPAEVALEGAGTLNLTTSGTTLSLSSSVVVSAYGYGGTVTQSAGTTLTSGADFWFGGNGSNGGGATNTAYYHQTGGTFTSMNMYAGYNSGAAYGKYVQDGGVHNVNGGLSGILFGYSSGAPGGEYDLNAGTLNVGVGLLAFGGYGVGNFNFGGGTLVAGSTSVVSRGWTNMNLVASTNSTVDPNGNTIQFQNGLIGAGSITLGGIHGGTVNFSGNNTYTGATTVVGGTLYLSAGSISTSSDIQVANGATYQVLVSASTSLSLYSRLISTDPNALQLKGSIPAIDTTLNGTSVTMQWRPRTSAEVIQDLASDVLTLGSAASGATQAYALAMNYSAAAAPAGAAIAWYNAGAWDLNATDGNTGNSASGGELGYVGSFAAFQAAYGTTLDNYIGAYGYDPVGDQAWAVLDHPSSSFAVAAAVPEPATLVLLGMGVVMLLGYGWRRRR